ncbi:MAG: N-formylglutamate amidohydrolase [Maritimibacter sp.]
MSHPVYDLFLPETRNTSVVFASPHSGDHYDRTFLKRSMLDERTLRSSEDAFIDQLFAAAPRNGAPLIAARFPRAYVDLNRGADELDPALIRGIARKTHNPRVASGLGVIPRVVSGGREIYRGKLSQHEAEERLERCWHPFHVTLQSLITESHHLFGNAILIDCHSMPHDALANLWSKGGPKPEIVLGDRFGASASAAVIEPIEKAFRDAGFRVVRNSPFAGAYTAQHYGRPSRRQHAVQIEIDRSLYMDEARIRPNADFDRMQQLLSGIVAEITKLGRPAEKLPLAAE